MLTANYFPRRVFTSFRADSFQILLAFQTKSTSLESEQVPADLGQNGGAPFQMEYNLRGAANNIHIDF